jgi:hypothetical protein
MHLAYNTYMKLSYPLKLTFKLIAFAPRVKVLDAQGKEIFYIEQKALAIRESVKVFNTEKDKELLYTMQANQVIDFGATYSLRNAKNEKELGTVQQEGVRSLFQASYHVADTSGKEAFTIVQSNPMIALLDSLISIIPFAELVSGYILNPTYSIATSSSKKPILEMKKKPSFFESSFEITKKDDIAEEQELLLLLACMMVVQLEKNRG